MSGRSVTAVAPLQKGCAADLDAMGLSARSVRLAHEVLDLLHGRFDP